MDLYKRRTYRKKKGGMTLEHFKETYPEFYKFLKEYTVMKEQHLIYHVDDNFTTPYTDTVITRLISEIDDLNDSNKMIEFKRSNNHDTLKLAELYMQFKFLASFKTKFNNYYKYLKIHYTLDDATILRYFGKHGFMTLPSLDIDMALIEPYLMSQQYYKNYLKDCDEFLNQEVITPFYDKFLNENKLTSEFLKQSFTELNDTENEIQESKDNYDSGDDTDIDESGAHGGFKKNNNKKVSEKEKEKARKLKEKEKERARKLKEKEKEKARKLKEKERALKEKQKLRNKKIM